MGGQLLGEAKSAAPRGVARVWGHPLGGLIVLGELQGGRRLVTKRPQAAMLRFIWEALRKSRPLRLEKMRFCLCSRGLLSMTGSQKVTCGGRGQG